MVDSSPTHGVETMQDWDPIWQPPHRHWVEMY